MRILAFLMGCYLLVPLSYTLYVAGTADESFCYYWDSVISGVLLVFLLVFGIGFTVKMWFVHDAYFLKTRLKVVAIVICVFGIPYLIVGEFLALIPAVWFEAGSNVFSVMSICSIWSPTIYTYIQFRRSAKNSISTSGASEGTSASDLTTSESFTSKRPFESDPAVAKLLKKNDAFTYIQEYLIHYQYIRLSDYLNFWQRLQAFKLIPEKKALAGHAYLIYQKYLIPNAYIYIDCFTDEQRETVRKIVQATVDAESDVDIDLFDDLLDTIEPILAEQLFKPFMKSEFYTKLRKTKGLEDMGKEEVELQVTK